MTEPKTRRSIAGLDLIRFAAASMVVLYHLAYLSWVKPPAILSDGTVATYSALSPISAFGWVGVEIFFVISGFVIAYSADGSGAYKFFRSRVVRLYPGAWICATITALALLLFAPVGLANLAADYVRSLLISPIGPWVDGVF